jgi:hypothetical protein
MQLFSEEDTLLWLSRGDMKAETEKEIIVELNQILQRTYRAMKM